MRLKFIYAATLFISLSWCLLILAVPLSAGGNFISKKLSGTMYLFFSVICHQIPERSFILKNHPLSVCIRCSAIYFGFFMGIVIYPLIQKLDCTIFPPRWILTVGIGLAFLEFSLAKIHIIQYDLFSRIFSGSILGGISAFFVMPALVDWLGFQRNRLDRT